MYPKLLDFKKIKTYPLKERNSLISILDFVDPNSNPSKLSKKLNNQIAYCSKSIKSAVQRNDQILCFYGGHFIKRGASLILNELIRQDVFTHIGTQGSGVIHCLESALLGKTSENVENNIATGRFGAWGEMSNSIWDALDYGFKKKYGFGYAVGRHIFVNDFKYKDHSILSTAFENKVNFTVHPGIGYDCYCVSPRFNGITLGAAAEIDFKLLCNTLNGFDNGVMLVIGSAVAIPQCIEKAFSVVNNLRLQEGKPILSGFKVFVIDISDGGNWDWSKSEPPKTNPAYYLRFCKTFSRLGGELNYVQCDNVAFIHNLYYLLKQ